MVDDGDEEPKPEETRPEAAAPKDASSEPQLGSRASLLVGGLALAFGAACFYAGRLSMPEAPAAPPAGSVAHAPRPRPSDSTDSHAGQPPPFPPLNSFPEVSFAQEGEDLIIKNIFAQLDIAEASYIDIGAHDPIKGSNSYLFYALGSKGVLVEPNPTLAAKLRATRPRDVVVDKGIAFGTEKAAPYYDFGGDGQDDTFSKEQVDRLAKLGQKPNRVINVPLVDVNEVLATNFPKEPPSLLSVDVEGLDLAILKKIDFERFRPPVICAETAEVDTGHVIAEITTFLASKKYVPRGGTYVNTIFVAEEAAARSKDGGR